MHVCWNLYRFDYARYLMLRPRLRCATTPDALAALDESEENAALAEEFEEGALTLEEARNGELQLLCCEGEPLTFDHTLPTFLANLSRRKGAEEAGEALAALLTGAPNMEKAWQCERGLHGFLTPQETAAVYEALISVSRGRVRKVRTRRGGLLGGVVAFVRNLLAAGPLEDDAMRLLLQLLYSAVQREQGIALVAG